jgi:hypothetical protein
MRGTLLALLAGLLAVTAPASAIYLEGADQTQRHHVVLDITTADCPDAAVLCIVDLDGNLSMIATANSVNFTIHNRLARQVTLEIRTIPSPDAEDASRFASQLLVQVTLAAGESTEVAEIAMPEDVTYIRLQASDGAAIAERDQDLLNMRIMASGPGGPDNEHVEATSDKEPRDSPFLPALWFLVVLGLATVLVAMTRNK